MPRTRFPILFVTSSRIGDAVLTSGLIRRLVEEVPDAAFTIVAGPLAAPLFRDTPGLERLIPLEKEKGGMHWFKLWRRLRGRRWGLVVDFRGPLLGRVLSAKRRAIRKPSEPGAEPVHKVVEAARLLRLEGDPPAPFLFTSPDTEAAAKALVAGDTPILAIAPAANWVGKTWPAERFAVAAAELMSPRGPLSDARVLLLGGPEDRWAAEAVRRVISRDRLIDLVGKIDLLTAYACLKEARLFIGNDSGLMHLAAAAGTPTLGLFGPSDDRLYGPWGQNARALRGPREFEAFKAIDPALNQAVCHMLDLPVEWVVNAAKKLLADTAPKTSAAPVPTPAPAPVMAPVPPPAEAAPPRTTGKVVPFVKPAPADLHGLEVQRNGVEPMGAEMAVPVPSPVEVPDDPPAPVETPPPSADAAAKAGRPILAREPAPELDLQPPPTPAQAPREAPPEPPPQVLAEPEPAPKPPRKPRAPRVATKAAPKAAADPAKPRAPRKKKTPAVADAAPPPESSLDD